MAGDWIPVRTGLQNEPEVVRIVSAICPDGVRDLSARVRTTSVVIGALVQTWSLFDSLTDDGLLEGYTGEWLDAQVGIDGFAEQMERVGWLRLNAESLEMTGFSTYLGRSAKRRIKDAQRKRDERSGDETSASRPQPVRSGADKKRTNITEDNRTEDNKKPTPASAGVCPDPQSGPADGSPSGTGYIFATKSGAWELPARKLAEYEACYPFDVHVEMRKAIQYCRDNPAKRKSKGGMPAFLTRWLNREHDKRGSPASSNRTSNEEATDRLRQRLERMARERQEQEAGK